MGKVLDWNSKSSCKTKISQLKNSISVDEKILWFEISVQNLVFMTFCSSIQKLVKEGLNLFCSKISVVIVQKLLKILVQVLEDKSKLFVRVQNID